MIVVRHVVAGAVLQGVDAAELLAAAELPPEELADEDAFVSPVVVARLFAAAERLTGDVDFGLHLAERALDAPVSNSLQYVCRNSRTVGEALERMARYHGLLHTAVQVRIEVEHDTARLVFRPAPGTVVPSRHAAETLLALLALRGRKELGPGFAVRRVGFMHSAPERTSEHARVFQAPVLFDQPCHSLVFDRACLDAPLPMADPALGQVLDRCLSQLGVGATAPARFADQVRQRITDLMKGQCPPVETVAARMHMSPRTLQRRLRDEGTQYAELLNDVRRELALRHLEEGRESISEIAFLLGFSEVSTFHRAFKRWCGQTPAEFRRQHRTRGAS